MPEVKGYDLPGVKTCDLRVIPDERGFFSEAARRDWGELLEGDEIAQVNVSFSYPHCDAPPQGEPAPPTAQNSPT